MQEQTMEHQECFQGHLYDVTLPECPYCPPLEHQRREEQYPINDVSKTIMPPETIMPDRDVQTPPAPPKPKEPSPPQEKSVYVTVLRGEFAGNTELIQRKAFIGSKASNQIVVDEPEVKPIHATITIVKGTVSLINASTDGIEVNGVKQYGRYTLKHNDKITIGKTVLRVEIV